ncbi:hypothetical protein BDZ45DRAFT_105363 [Acephala macrosclerotiorum]|nr:hypothetical protein BDZ45DRAFT_105363 [Acephala macrosclerotiorum]
METNFYHPSSSVPNVAQSSKNSLSPPLMMMFTYFPEFLIEIRRMVWKLAGNHPRLVGSRRVEHDIHSQEGYDDPPWGPIDFPVQLSMVLHRSVCPRPAVLQVYRESRNERLPSFEPIGGMQLDLFRYKDGRDPHLRQTVLTMLSNEPRVYFNAVGETMCLAIHLDDGYLGATPYHSQMDHTGTSLRSIAFGEDVFCGAQNLLCGFF